MEKKDITCEIKEHIGVISVSKGGWSRELNLVSWNGAEAKYDIRDWNPDHSRQGHGVNFTEEEAKTLCRFLCERGLGSV